MEIDARLQPHLGRLQENYKPHLDMNTLSLAKVTKIHHKQGTMDLQVIKSKDSISSSPENEGKYSARAVTSSAHYNPDTGASSGKMEPYVEGQLVLLAFLDGQKSQPVILGSFHQTWESEHNVLPGLYPLDPEKHMLDKREATKSLDVHPSQFYKRVDGIGALEMSHPSKTFIQMDPDLYNEITDAHEEYDHIDLNEKDPYMGTTRSAKTEEAMYPVKFLFVHRSNFEDYYTTWTKMFIDSTGMLRLTRDNNDGKLSFVEMSEEGNMKLRRQNDSPKHGQGEDYSEMGITQTGVVHLDRSIKGKTSTIALDEYGDIILSHKDGPMMKLTKDGMTGGDSGGGSGGSGLVVVSDREDPAWANGTLWIDTSGIKG